MVGKRPINHGTPGGYTTHQQRGEQPCPPCVEAKKVYDKTYRTSGRPQQLHRARATAQGRARARLVQAHKPEYDRYYEEEKAFLKERGEWPE